MIRSILVSSLAALSLVAGPIFAAEYAIALSPYQSPESAKQKVTTALQFSTGLEPGDRVHFFDGYEASLLGTFTIPKKSAYRSAKARLAVNGGTVKALMAFAASAQSPAGDREPAQIGSTRLPQLLRAIAAGSGRGEPLEVIVQGSSLYDDPREPIYTMTGGRYPSDGHLLRHRGETVFGALGSSGLLNGSKVHLAYGDRGQFQSEGHQYYVERFWALYVEALGGELVSFVPKLDAALSRISSKARAIPHGFEGGASDKLEMIRIKPPEPRQSIYERELSSQPLPSTEVQRAGKVEVGLSWDCAACDLDIYAVPYPGADPIYFGNAQTVEGTLWKDHQSSPRAGQGFETIAFHRPLDLRALTLAVNFYRGKAPQGVQGELRLAADEKTYGYAFHIPATSGNSGAGMLEAFETGEPPNEQTLLIEPVEVYSVR